MQTLENLRHVFRSVTARTLRLALALCTALPLSTCALEVDDATPEVASIAEELSGALDSSFGQAGKVRTPIDLGGAPRGALQPDGKLIVAATVQDLVVGNPGLFGVVRYLANGQLDSSFGTAGIARTTFTDKAIFLNGFALGSDGKITAVGETSYQVVTPTAVNNVTAIAMARYTNSGALDASFGQAGKLLISVLGKSDRATAALALAGGKLLVGAIAVDPAGAPGYSALRKLALLRFNADGTLDASFGQGGKVIGDRISVGPSSLALQADGSVLALVGTVAYRFSAAGSPLPLALSLPLTLSPAGFSGAAFQPDGKIVVAGAVKGTNKHRTIIKMRRQLLDGTADVSFDSPAFAYTPGGTSAGVNSILVQPSGRIIVTAGAELGLNGGTAFGVAALLANGPLDAAFGSGGTLTTTFTSRDQGTALVQQPDGKFLALGMSADSNGEHYAIAIARYLP